MILLVPSRGRPENIAALSEAIKETATTDPWLMVAVDDDDPTLDGYRNLELPGLYIGPSRRLGPWLNALAAMVGADDHVIGFMGDDHRPRSVGWDARIAEALAPSPGIAYGNDLIQGPNLPTAAFMTSDIIKTLGYMVPEGLIHLEIDSAWKALGEAAGCLRYLPDVIIEHLHPIAGKAEWDEGYVRANAGDVAGHDYAVFEQWRREVLPIDAEKVKAL